MISKSAINLTGKIGFVSSRSDNPLLDKEVLKLSDEFSKKYKKIANQNDIHIFHAKTISLVMGIFAQTDFKDSLPLLKEIKYFIHYSFLVMQDDYFLGKKIFKKNITKFDDYIFSKYRKVPELETNIQKLVVLSYNNRFDKDPKRNFLAYFVFIEEQGVDLSSILQDFYQILENSEKKKSLFKLGSKFRSSKIYEKYLKQDSNYHKNNNDNHTTDEHSFLTVMPSRYDKTKDIHIKIFKDNLKIPKHDEN